MRNHSNKCSEINDESRGSKMSSITSSASFTGASFTGAREHGRNVRSRLRITKRGRAVLTTLAVFPLVVVALLVGLNSGQAAAGGSPSNVSFQHVTVGAGDSLWNIAERIAPNSDPRDVVAALEDLNGLSDSNVDAGQTLSIPLQYSVHH